MTAQAILTVVASLGLWLVSATGALAYPHPDSNPFPSNAKPARVKTHEFPSGIKEVTTEKIEVESIMFRDCLNDHDIVLRLSDIGAAALSADLRIDGEVYASGLPGGYAGRWFISAALGDLNLDGIPDYIINHWFGGCGRAAGGEQVTFLLSTKKGYTSTSILAAYARPDNYVMLNGRPCFIQTTDDGVRPCKDGFGHYFYIHNIVTFENGEVRVDNSLYPGFPMTQWDQRAIDHNDDPRAFDWKESVGSETTLLTDGQKQDLLRRAQEEIFQ